MPNNNQRPWYKDPKIIIPAIVVILAAIIGGTFVIYASFPQTPTGPIFKEIGGDTDTDGDYEISWERARRATLYILQEDEEPLFTSPKTLHRGFETKKVIYSKSDGDYYYRVRACNDAGESEWSPIRKITVIISTSLTPPPTPTSTSTPTPTPTLCIIDTMDSTSGWRTYKDDDGSSINIESISGKTDNAIAISYDLKEWGWVTLNKRIDPSILSEIEGMRFFYKGTGKPNTIEFKLMYSDGDEYNGIDTTFGFLINAATVKDDWTQVEVPYDMLECWWSDKSCDDNPRPDLNKVRKIEFAISNKPEDGDASGSGKVIIDDVQGITP